MCGERVVGSFKCRREADNAGFYLEEDVLGLKVTAAYKPISA
jgi:hypothetical protein